MADKYNTLLAQLTGRLEVIDKENRQTHTLIEQVGKAVEAAAKPENLPVQEHRHTYTLDLKSSKTFLTMFVMLGGIFLQGAFIYRISENNQLLAVNDLKYRYVKMCGKIGEKGADGVGNRIFGTSNTQPYVILSKTKSNAMKKP